MPRTNLVPNRRRSLATALALVVAGGLAGCHAADHDAAAQTPEGFAAIDRAVAVIHPTEGNEARGWVRFTRTGERSLRVEAQIEGLEPDSFHGFHIHEFGDCTAPDAMSAGGHYDPAGHPHGPPTAPIEERHAGDLGNLESDGEGVARYSKEFEGVTIAGAMNPILGRSVVVHEARDDLVSQPTGDAGARIGCGVIGVANPNAAN